MLVILRTLIKNEDITNADPHCNLKDPLSKSNCTVNVLRF